MAPQEQASLRQLNHVEMVYRPGERDLAGLEREDFDATLDRVRAAEGDPDLAGRVTLLGVYDPSEPGALAPGMFQAFVRTDVVVGGLLILGQLVELQWHLPKRASGAAHA